MHLSDGGVPPCRASHSIPNAETPPLPKLVWERFSGWLSRGDAQMCGRSVVRVDLPCIFPRLSSSVAPGLCNDQHTLRPLPGNRPHSGSRGQPLRPLPLRVRVEGTGRTPQRGVSGKRQQAAQLRITALTDCPLAAFLARSPRQRRREEQRFWQRGATSPNPSPAHCADALLPQSKAWCGRGQHSVCRVP